MEKLAEKELAKLDAINWGIRWGIIELQLKEGKITLITMKETFKRD